MNVRRNRATRTLATQTAELALAAPQVVAHRVARMALAGPTPSSRDRKEFERMIVEKNAAFAQSWMAMSAQAVLASQALAATFFRSFLPVSKGRRPSAAATASQLQKSTLGILGKGLEPVHGKAVANARRLARTRLR